MFPFLIIGLFFAVCSFFTGMLAICTRVAGYFSGFLTLIALFFQVITTCLMTYVSLQLELELFQNQNANFISVLSLSRAATLSRVTARTHPWVSRHTPLCGPHRPASSFRACCTASVVPLAGKMLAADTVDARSAAVVSSPRSAQTA